MKTIKLLLQKAGFPALLLLFSLFATAQDVSQRKGVDPAVRYDSLLLYGPWDDRNYQLTADDLKLFAPNEAALRDPIPAFYRIILRKKNPKMRRTGTAQYPMNALQMFLIEYGGYQVNGKIYQQIDMENGQFKVLEKEKPRRQVLEKSLALSSEVRVSSPSPAGECSIKINPVNPDLVVAGSNGPGGGQRMYYSSDGGQTWTMVDLPLGSTCCDPTVEWSSDGVHAYAATLGIQNSDLGIWFYRSGDNGHTWTDLEVNTPGDPRRELTTSGSDKEFLHVDKHSSSPYRDNVYLAWHEGNVQQFGRSTNRGDTWTTTSFGGDPIGIGSDITTDRNGNIYYLWHAFGSQQVLLKRSTNGGTSFLPGAVVVSATNGGFGLPIPAQEARQAHIVVAADADLSNGPYGGSVYAAWTDTYGPVSSIAANNHTRVLVAFSRDQGATWTVVTPHPTTDQNTVDRWHPWIAVGRDGTVHVIYYDTRNSVNRTGVDLYYSNSTDGGQTYSTPKRLTDVTSPNINDGFEFGDYNGLDHVVCQLAIYTDNRDESGFGGDSKDVYTVGIDAEPPAISCPGNLNVPTDHGQCTTNHNFPANASDACSAVTVTYTPALGTPLNVGTTTISAKAIDGSGNTKTCQFTVTVADNQPPAISCPANRTQGCDEPVTPTSTGNPVTLDNCGVASTIHSDVTGAGSCPGNSILTRTWVVTDVHALTNSCVQIITIQDTKPPVVTCPANIVVDCVTTPTSTGTATALDNCDAHPMLSFSDSAPTGDCAWLCSFDRTWVGTDNCGNAANCVQKITKSALPLIESALGKDVNGDGRPDALVLGQGSSVLTIPVGRGNCVLQWLPSVGTVPSGMTFNNSPVGANCKPGNNPVDVNGKLTNPLLAEALKLNILVRLKPTLGTKKLSAFTDCTFAPIVLVGLSLNPDVNELLRVTNLALGNVALQPHLPELLAALQCINGPLNVCD